MNHHHPLVKSKQILFSLDQTYVTQVCTNSNSSKLAVSGSNHLLKVYSSDLTLEHCITRHTNSITAIQFDPTDSNLLYSTDLNGQTFAFDLRTNQSVKTWGAGSNLPNLSMSVSPLSNMLACGTELVGSESAIHFYDLRMPALLNSFTESHSDDITSLSFHPTINSRLLSGSTDGLVNIFDIRKWDEDDDLSASLPSGSSVCQAGWFGVGGEYLWMTTHTETCSIWTVEGDLIIDYGDIRCQSPTCAIDYAIHFQFNPIDQQLYLVTGSNTGTIHVMRAMSSHLEPCYSIEDGHSDTVRSVVVDFSNERVVSCGEDSRITLFVGTPDDDDENKQVKKERNRKKAAGLLFSPY